MTTVQKVIKYLAIAFAIFLTVTIIGGILSAVGALGGFFAKDAVLDQDKTYSVAGEVKSLVIQINAADLVIRQADQFSVTSNLKYLSVEENGGVLTIKETKKFSGKYNESSLTLTIPENTDFDQVNISTGACRLTADKISAAKLCLELGAGEVNIQDLVATTKAQIEGGAGKVTISGGALQDLDLDMGVGELNLTSALTGECEFDLGVGDANIRVIGNKDSYALDVEKGIGNITIDGKSVSGMDTGGSGSDEIQINGGVGAIDLTFQAPEV